MEFLLDILRWIAKIRNPVFDILFQIITYCGDEIVFMAVAMMLFWCVSKKEGYYILTVGFIGTIINQFLKITFRILRPWDLAPDIGVVGNAKEAATGYSFPSGHTQNSVGTFGSIAYIFKKKWVKIVSIVLCVLVPFSRLYLGVHTLLDVGVSVVIALALVFGLRPIFNKVYDSTKSFLIFISIMIAMAVAFVLYLELFNFPAEVYVALKDGLTPKEHSLKNAYTLLGALIGMAVALPIERKYINFETKDKIYIQIIKVALGLGIVLGVKELLEVVLKPIFGSWQGIHAFRYFGVVMVAVCVYPLLFPLFRKIDEKITTKHKKKSDSE
jgi:undecaprenyl-diphosphatase